MGELLYYVPKVGFSPIKMVRELSLEHCETVRSISDMGVRVLRGLFPITRGSGRMHLWCISLRIFSNREFRKSTHLFDFACSCYSEPFYCFLSSINKLFEPSSYREVVLDPLR